MEYFGKIKGGKLNGEQAVKCGQMSTIGALHPSAMQFTIPEGVTSWNGEKGDVTYTPPVTSVNGQTGDVIVTGGVTSVNGEVGDVVLDASDVGALPDDTTYVSSFNGQSGAVTFSETDPTVPAWAKTPNKPTYTASEVGALPASTQFVSTFNGQSGAVTFTETDPTVPSWAKQPSKPTYTAQEVGALPSNTQFVSSVNGNTGAVTVSEMPSATNEADGTALVAVGGEWTKQTGYGYRKEGEIEDVDESFSVEAVSPYPLLSMTTHFTENEEYTATFDNTEYTLTAFATTVPAFQNISVVGIGNGQIFGVDIGDSTCPFVCVTAENTLNAIVVAVGGSHTIRITHIGDIPHKIDRELVDTIIKDMEGVTQIDGRTDNIYTGKSGAVMFPGGGAAVGRNSVSMGGFAIGDGSVTEGTWSKTGEMANYAHAEGSSEAGGEFSHAEGNSTTAYGSASHAEGNNTRATGSASHSEGLNTIAENDYAHAEGDNTDASGSASHAEGRNTTASGINSHAEGYSTNASASQSHAEGISTTANGMYSHAEGYQTIATGQASHAEGYRSSCYGHYSHAEGYAVTASSQCQHAFGKWNIADGAGTYVEIVGNGTDGSNPSNARTLDWSGNEVLAGKLTVGANPTANMDVVTKAKKVSGRRGAPATGGEDIPEEEKHPVIIEDAEDKEINLPKEEVEE